MRSLFALFVVISFCGCKNETLSPVMSPAAEAIELAEPVPDIVPAAAGAAIGPSIRIDYAGIGGGGGGGGGRRWHDRPSRGEDRFIHFVPNSYPFWIDPDHATTHLLQGCTGDDCVCTAGEEDCQALPAFADILVETENFVWCRGGPFALCYYSGPADETTDLSCTLTDDGRFANCLCFEIPWGAYLVDINAILNYAVYQETITVCGADGSGCSGPGNINKAPVCQAVNDNTLIPGADMVSTFSLDCVPTNGLGQTVCAPNVYAGCMTAPCTASGTPGIVECSCPTFSGPYVVGAALENPDECVLGGDHVWSASYSPTGTTIPPTDPCIPDAPGTNGCPLYNSGMSPPMGTDCAAICEAYSCQNAQGVEPAYTCDATLCTGQCNDRDLVQAACGDLADCPALGIIAIANLESEVGCSCCASQLCGCEPNDKTNNAIYDFDQRQRDLSITPQCDINMTLCGTPH